MSINIFQEKKTLVLMEKFVREQESGVMFCF